MKKFWKEGDRSRGICEKCKRLVDTEFAYRTFRITKPRPADVPDVLVAVCLGCDEIVSVPYQSTPKLNEARKAQELPLEARIPRHLDDILGTVASHYGRSDGEFRAAVFRFYLHAVAQSQGLSETLRSLLDMDIAKGESKARLSLKVQAPLMEGAWGQAQSGGIRTKTDMVKAVIILAAQDLDGKEGRERRKDLERIAAVV